MSIRVTEAEVLEIIDVDSSITNLIPFITAASLLVDEVLSDDTALSSSLLKEIERWLSAHFIAIRDPRVEMEKVGEAQNTYALGVKLGVRASMLDSTPYGQQAKALDITGRLSAIGKRRAELNSISLGL